MYVLRCFRKPAGGHPMVAEPTLVLEEGIGIRGDANADPLSPRQVLLVNRRTYEDFVLPPTALRENILVDGGVDALRSGQLLEIGATAQLRITIPCEPCRKLSYLDRSLPKNILGRRGVLARVVRGGAVQPEDPVRLLEHALAEVPRHPSERLYQILRQVPVGKVITFRQAVRAMGVTVAHVRTIPRVLRRAPTGTPIHRIVSSHALLIPQHVPQQPELLAAEGISPLEEGLVRLQHIWHGNPYSEQEATVQKT